MSYQKERKVYLSQLDTDHGTQMRSAIHHETVQQYLEIIDELPPIEVVETLDNELIVWDGFHRIEAWKLFSQLNRKGKDIKVPVNCQPGTAEDAVWLACGANSRHGMPMSVADKQRAVKTALEMFPDKTQIEIARHCGVSNGMAYNWRKKLRGESSQEVPDVTGSAESEFVGSQVGCPEGEVDDPFLSGSDGTEDRQESFFGGDLADEPEPVERRHRGPGDEPDSSEEQSSQPDEPRPSRAQNGDPRSSTLQMPYSPDWGQLQSAVGTITRWIDGFGAAHRMKESNPAQSLRGDVQELLENIVGWCHSVNGCLPPWSEAREWARNWAG